VQDKVGDGAVGMGFGDCAGLLNDGIDRIVYPGLAIFLFRDQMDGKDEQKQYYDQKDFSYKHLSISSQNEFDTNIANFEKRTV
jgi:hypothetical protein